MLNLAVETWLFFRVWFLFGVEIYFGYGRSHSRLNQNLAPRMAGFQEPAKAELLKTK